MLHMKICNSLIHFKISLEWLLWSIVDRKTPFWSLENREIIANNKKKIGSNVRGGLLTYMEMEIPTPRHRDLRPVHKGEEIVAQGRPGPSYLPPTANHRHASQPPPEASAASEGGARGKKRFGVRASGAARSERSEPRPCERPTRKIQQGRAAKKQWFFR